MIPDTTLWSFAFWLTLVVGTVSCVVAAIVLAYDFVVDWLRDPDPLRTEIRDRLRHLPKP